MLKVLPDLVRLRARSLGGVVREPLHPATSGCGRCSASIRCWWAAIPFQSTSIYALIHTLEQQWGVWFAMGGTGALVRALVRLFVEHRWRRCGSSAR